MAYGPESKSSLKIGIIQRYDSLAKIYDQLYGEEQRDKFQLAKVRKPGSILDVGCGTGLLLADLPENPMAVGLDISIGMLQQAKKRLGKKIHLVRGDASFPPFKPSTFSNMYAFTVIDPRQAEAVTKAINNLLAEDGIAALSASKKCFTPETFRAIIESSGLTAEDILDRIHVKDFVALCHKEN